MFSFSAGELKLMNHFVVKRMFLYTYQIQCVVFENQFFLPGRKIRPLADAAHGLGKSRVEMGIVRRHEHVGLADLSES